jgi:hypothetical protein
MPATLFCRVLPPGDSAHFVDGLDEAQHPPRALVHREFKVLAQKRSVHVLLVRLDHRIEAIRWRERLSLAHINFPQSSIRYLVVGHITSTE